ncbi:MAG: 50S ribosomal protein L11 methyltransferase [Deltaproteobacteria bacterium]|nr:MAG: 50S ribosomal protein L11 methyltransferase [Deltaproteobacteria bacterium]
MVILRNDNFMKWIAAKIIFYHENTQLATDLISEIFYDLGLKGVQIEDPELAPEETWGEGACIGPLQHAVIGFFPDTPQTADKLNELEKKIRSLERTLGVHCNKEFRQMDEEDWAESWKAFFWPQRITSRITVKPTWRDYNAESDEIVLEIDPGMAFGTGTHPTTALCITLIERYLSAGATFLDIGTGSGILMIAAARLGADRLVGIDNDETALGIAEKNLLLNHISQPCFEVKAGNLADGIDGRFDLIAANILSEAILKLLGTIGRHMLPKSVLICSGIYKDNCGDVLKKMQQQGLKILEELHEDSWVAIACSNPNASAA